MSERGVVESILNELEKMRAYHKVEALTNLISTSQLILDKGEIDGLTTFANNILAGTFSSDEVDRKFREIVPEAKWTPLMRSLLKIIKLDEL